MQTSLRKRRWRGQHFGVSALNSTIPTCFRSDLLTCLGQAQGGLGCHSNDELFGFLRGAFQALESFLPGDLLLDHVAGHTGEGWNEMCDWLAKQERHQSFLHPRPCLNLMLWKKLMPHLWMLLSTGDGLLPRCGTGLWEMPPGRLFHRSYEFERAG